MFPFLLSHCLWLNYYSCAAKHCLTCLSVFGYPSTWRHFLIVFALFLYFFFFFLYTLLASFFPRRIWSMKLQSGLLSLLPIINHIWDSLLYLPNYLVSLQMFLLFWTFVFSLFEAGIFKRIVFSSFVLTFLKSCVNPPLALSFHCLPKYLVGRFWWCSYFLVYQAF